MAANHFAHLFDQQTSSFLRKFGNSNKIPRSLVFWNLIANRNQTTSIDFDTHRTFQNLSRIDNEIEIAHCIFEIFEYRGFINQVGEKTDEVSIQFILHVP